MAKWIDLLKFKLLSGRPVINIGHERFTWVEVKDLYDRLLRGEQTDREEELLKIALI